MVLFGSTVIFVGVLLMYIVISCCIYIFTVIVHLNNTYVNRIEIHVICGLIQ